MHMKQYVTGTSRRQQQYQSQAFLEILRGSRLDNHEVEQ